MGVGVEKARHTGHVLCTADHKAHGAPSKAQVPNAALASPQRAHARHRSTYPATAVPEPLLVGAGVGACSPASLSGPAVPSLLPLPISLLLVALHCRTATLIWA